MWVRRWQRFGTELETTRRARPSGGKAALPIVLLIAPARRVARAAGHKSRFLLMSSFPDADNMFCETVNVRLWICRSNEKTKSFYAG